MTRKNFSAPVEYSPEGGPLFFGKETKIMEFSAQKRSFFTIIELSTVKTERPPASERCAARRIGRSRRVETASSTLPVSHGQRLALDTDGPVGNARTDLPHMGL